MPLVVLLASDDRDVVGSPGRLALGRENHIPRGTSCAGISQTSGEHFDDVTAQDRDLIDRYVVKGKTNRRKAPDRVLNLGNRQPNRRSTIGQRESRDIDLNDRALSSTVTEIRKTND